MNTRKTRIHRLLILPALLLLAPVTGRAEPAPSTRTEVMIPMSDGTKLSADIHLPTSGNDFPVVLVRSPYGKRQLAEHIAEPLATHGYAVVMQDVRGMGASDGMFIPFINEKKDGISTLNWVTEQSWCNGKVGMWGSSYLAYCALILTPERHPALEAVFNISGWGNTMDMTSPGGAMHLMIAAPWTLSRQIRGQGSVQQIDWPTAFRHLPVTDIPKALGIESPQWQGAVEMFTTDYLQATSSVAPRYGDVKTPIFHLTGWYDFVGRNTIDIYEGVDQVAAPTKDKTFQKLMVGAWYHDQQWGDDTLVGDLDFGPKSPMGMKKIVKLTARWFDKWLKGIDNGVDREDPVELFVMGPNEWRSFDQWPPRAVQSQNWYFASRSGANGLDGDGTLSTTAPTGDSKDTFVFDPMDPVPTHGGANCHFFRKTLGILDQREIERRKDVLVYTSPPLRKELAVIGPLKVVLYAATEGRHTDFTAKLVEVRTDGYARIIEDGIRRGPDSSPLREIQPMDSGKVYRFTIDLNSTAIVIPKGHSLRVEISSSNFPKYTRNPNTGESPEEAVDFKKVKQTVMHSEAYPSHIVLPVLKGGAE